MRCSASSALASSREMPVCPVMRRSRGVMQSRTRIVDHFSAGTKRRSRLVMMPWRAPSGPTTGRPETLYWPHSSSSWEMVASGPTVTGSETMPDSERLTRRT